MRLVVTIHMDNNTATLAELSNVFANISKMEGVHDVDVDQPLDEDEEE